MSLNLKKISKVQRRELLVKQSLADLLLSSLFRAIIAGVVIWVLDMLSIIVKSSTDIIQTALMFFVFFFVFDLIEQRLIKKDL